MNLTRNYKLIMKFAGFERGLDEAGIKGAIEKLLQEKKQLKEENKAINTRLSAINTTIAGIKSQLQPTVNTPAYPCQYPFQYQKILKIQV